VVHYLPLPVGVGGPGGAGCVSLLGPLFACSWRGLRGCIRGEVCGAGPDPLRPPSKHSAPTVLCRACRGVPGHASSMLAVLVFSSGVLARDYRASRHGRPLGLGWVCCDATFGGAAGKGGHTLSSSSGPSEEVESTFFPSDYFPRVATLQRQVGEPQVGARWTGMGVRTLPGAPE